TRQERLKHADHADQILNTSAESDNGLKYDPDVATNRPRRCCGVKTLERPGEILNIITHGLSRLEYTVKTIKYTCIIRDLGLKFINFLKKYLSDDLCKCSDWLFVRH